MFLLAEGAPARSINWGSSVGSALYDSSGASLGDSYTFEIGSFGSFVPTASNMNLWVANWKVFDRAEAPAGSGWNSALGFFASSANLKTNGTSSKSPSLPAATFAQGEKAYIWVFNTKALDAGTEWVLVTNDAADGNGADDWKFPAPSDQTSLPLDWRLGNASAVVFGGLDNTEGDGEFSAAPANFNLQTHRSSEFPLPPIVATLAATSITGTSVTLNGTVNAGHNHSAAVSFDYGASDSYGTTVAGTPSPATDAAVTSVSATLTGLAPGATYHFRVNATSDAGTSHGADLAVTTLGNNANLASLVLGGATLGPAFSGDITGYTASVSAATETVTLAPAPADSQATVTVNNLPVTSGHPSPVISLNIGSNVIKIVVTAPDATAKTYTVTVTRSLRVGSSVATAVTSGWATLHGMVNPNGQPTTVFFEYGSSTAYGSRTLTMNLDGGIADQVVSYNVAGLARGKTYHFRMVVSNADGTYYGEDQTFSTPVAPSPPAWHSAQLTSTANASGGIRASAAHNTWYLTYYKGADDQLWCVYWNGNAWVQQALGTTANVDDWLASYSPWNLVYYKGADNHLWCVFFDGSAWVQRKLSSVANVAGDVVVESTWGTALYRGTDGAAWAAYWDGHQWRQRSLGGAANVAGSLSVDSAWHVLYYRGSDGQLWCFYLAGGTWRQAQLSKTANVGGGVTGDSGGVAYYRSSADNSAWAVYWTGKTWAQAVLDASANLSDAMTLYARYVSLYVDANAQCSTLSWNGGRWVHGLLGDGGSGLTGRPSVHPATRWVFCRRQDGNMVIFYYQ